MSSTDLNLETSESQNEPKKEYSNAIEVIEDIKEIDNDTNELLKQALKNKAKKEKLYKILVKFTNKTIKDYEKTKKKKHNGKGGGLSVPYEISSILKEFLSLEDKKYSRGEITTILTEFIKEKNLKNPDNPKLLKFTKKSAIFKILQVREENVDLRNLNEEEMINVKVFGGINKYIQHHFLKSPTE
jgi:hypothetical protein